MKIISKLSASGLLLFPLIAAQLSGCVTVNKAKQLENEVRQLYDEVAASAARDTARAERVQYSRDQTYVGCTSRQECESTLPTLDIPQGVIINVKTTKSDSEYLYLVTARHERGTPEKLYTLEGGVKYKTAKKSGAKKKKVVAKAKSAKNAPQSAKKGLSKPKL